ncbi:MAG: hypothetical protein AB1454_07750 [Candidatus Auribacterota bacterium]
MSTANQLKDISAPYPSNQLPASSGGPGGVPPTLDGEFVLTSSAISMMPSAAVPPSLVTMKGNDSQKDGVGSRIWKKIKNFFGFGEVHGNSKLSKKPQHGYVITDSEGNILEYGVSGQKLNKNGTSPRVGQKIRIKYSNVSNYSGSVIEKNLKNRQEALTWEQQKVSEYKALTGEAPPNQLRPMIE